MNFNRWFDTYISKNQHSKKKGKSSLDLEVVAQFSAMKGLALTLSYSRYTKTPMGKKRSKILEGDDEEKGKEKGKKK